MRMLVNASRPPLSGKLYQPAVAPSDRWDMKTEPCAIFPVQSGVPVIGLGIFIAAIGIIGYLLSGEGAMPLPVAAILVGFGIFLIWLGIAR